MKRDNPEKERRWRAAFIKERTYAFDIAVRYMAERFGDGGNDLINLVWSGKLGEFTERVIADDWIENGGSINDRIIVRSEDWLLGDIKRFLGRSFAYEHIVLDFLRAMAGTWDEKVDVDEFEKEEDAHE